MSKQTIVIVGVVGLIAVVVFFCVVLWPPCAIPPACIALSARPRGNKARLTHRARAFRAAALKRCADGMVDTSTALPRPVARYHFGGLPHASPFAESDDCIAGPCRRRSSPSPS
jgi:hypothetical protein